MLCYAVTTKICGNSSIAWNIASSVTIQIFENEDYTNKGKVAHQSTTK